MPLISSSNFRAYNAWPTFVIPFEVCFLGEAGKYVCPSALTNVVEHNFYYSNSGDDLQIHNFHSW
jgi:hypothetical protein